MRKISLGPYFITIQDMDLTGFGYAMMPIITVTSKWWKIHFEKMDSRLAQCWKFKLRIIWIWNWNQKWFPWRMMDLNLGLWSSEDEQIRQRSSSRRDPLRQNRRNKPRHHYLHSQQLLCRSISGSGRTFLPPTTLIEGFLSFSVSKTMTRILRHRALYREADWAMEWNTLSSLLCRDNGNALRWTNHEWLSHMHKRSDKFSILLELWTIHSTCVPCKVILEETKLVHCCWIAWQSRTCGLNIFITLVLLSACIPLSNQDNCRKNKYKWRKTNGILDNRGSRACDKTVGDWDCFKTQILLGLLKIRNQYRVELCVSSEVGHFVLEVGCVRNISVSLNSIWVWNYFSGCWFVHGWCSRSGSRGFWLFQKPTNTRRLVTRQSPNKTHQHRNEDTCQTRWYWIIQCGLYYHKKQKKLTLRFALHGWRWWSGNQDVFQAEVRRWDL